MRGEDYSDKVTKGYLFVCHSSQWCKPLSGAFYLPYWNGLWVMSCCVVLCCVVSEGCVLFNSFTSDWPKKELGEICSTVLFVLSNISIKENLLYIIIKNEDSVIGQFWPQLIHIKGTSVENITLIQDACTRVLPLPKFCLDVLLW